MSWKLIWLWVVGYGRVADSEDPVERVIITFIYSMNRAPLMLRKVGRVPGLGLDPMVSMSGITTF
jgi:hypothetical protein